MSLSILWNIGGQKSGGNIYHCCWWRYKKQLLVVVFFQAVEDKKDKGEVVGLRNPYSLPKGEG